MAKNNLSKPIGLNVYQDDKGRYVYYNRLSKKAYQILRSDYKKFNVLSTRFLTSIAVGYLAYALSNNLIIGAVAAVLIYVSMFIAFNKAFIKGDTYVDNFKPDRSESFVSRMSKNTTKGKCIILIVLLIAIAVLSVINVKTQNYEPMIVGLNYTLVVGAIIVAGLYVAVLINKTKNN